jgi:squalene synthase HpnC
LEGVTLRLPATTLPRTLHRFAHPRLRSSRIAQAQMQTRAITKGADENFHVVTALVPSRLRQDFANLYAFCRSADDLADETGDPSRALELLREWRNELRECFGGRPSHPIFVALRETILRHDLPAAPFENLLSAFDQDQYVSRYATWAQLLDYSRHSANPVGRLVLMVCGYRDEFRLMLSDHTCTALQLTNFWQDVRRDVLDRNRVYIPRDVASRHGLDLDALATAVASGDVRDVDAAYRAMLAELTAMTQALFDSGRALLPTLSTDVRAPIRLFMLGGEAVLGQIVAGQFTTHVCRPRLGRVRKLALFARAWAGRWSGDE